MSKEKYRHKRDVARFRGTDRLAGYQKQINQMLEDADVAQKYGALRQDVGGDSKFEPFDLADAHRKDQR